MHLEIERALLDVVLLWILTAPHEFAHAWVATRLGDDTPLREGRVTLNPLAHVDWLGTAILPFVTSLLSGGFIGWGKPVRTEVAKLKGGLNGLALVALAGTAIVTQHAPFQLKRYVYGDQVGTTSLAFITGSIQPTAQPKPSSAEVAREKAATAEKKKK